MTLSMSVKSRYHILLYVSSLLSTSPSFTFIEKKEWCPLVILNCDFAF